MNEIEIQLLFDNGKLKDTMKLKYFLFQPRLIQIDNDFYVQVSIDRYQQSLPQQYKTKITDNDTRPI